MQILAILGSGFISEYYASSILAQRSKDKILIAASRSEGNTKKFAKKVNVPEYSTDLNKAINHPEVSIVVIGLPNYLHLETVLACAKSSKGVICTKPLRRKEESHSGWVFPVADENQDFGYNHMFNDIFSTYENGTKPIETFYDGSIINALMDTAYFSVKSKSGSLLKLKIGQEKYQLCLKSKTGFRITRNSNYSKQS